MSKSVSGFLDKQTEKVIDGNTAAAEALRQIDPDVFGFYPITPTSYIGEKYSQFVADGKVNTEYVCAESEHAAMSICVGAAAAGSRTCTATASQGLILMSEVLWNAAGMRLPIVMVNGNRSLGAPLSIHCDHSDAMAVRDAGWLQFYAKDAQEVYDFLLCAYKIAEHADVRTPIMIGMDCFQTTHTMMNMLVESDQDAKDFVGEFVMKDGLLDIDNPVSYGSFDKPSFYMEHRRAQLEGVMNAEKVAKKVFSEFKDKFDRGAATLVETYKTEDADFVYVVMGSSFGTIKKSVDNLREDGKKVGVIRLKVFRPFPRSELLELLVNFKNILVLDRISPAGASWGPLGSEILTVFAGNLEGGLCIKNAIYGLGSRETNDEDYAQLYYDFESLPVDLPKWVNLRAD